MAGYWQYVEICETTLLEGSSQKVIVDPLKIELLPQLPRTYVVPSFGPGVVPKGRGGLLAQSTELRLSRSKRYIVLTARTSESEPSRARRLCSDQIDRGIASLAMHLGVAIFARRIYRGWIDDGDKVIVETVFRGAEPIPLPRQHLADDLLDIARHLDQDAEGFRRYTLMSRFFSKALHEPATEEQFLFLWTILEIFPMKATTDIRPVSEFLGEITGRQVPKLKEQLGIGRLYGARSRLVHEGELGIDDGQLPREIGKLEDICLEALRALAGRGYSGNLDKYLDNQV